MVWSLISNSYYLCDVYVTILTTASAERLQIYFYLPATLISYDIYAEWSVAKISKHGHAEQASCLQR